MKKKAKKLKLAKETVKTLNPEGLGKVEGQGGSLTVADMGSCCYCLIIV